MVQKKKCVKERQSQRKSEFVKVGQTSETSGGVRMMRGRDEVLQCICVCVCVGNTIKDILSIRSITCYSFKVSFQMHLDFVDYHHLKSYYDSDLMERCIVISNKSRSVTFKFKTVVPFVF